MIGYEGEIWVCYFWFVSWTDISVGASVNLRGPHIELHVPFGFFKFGRRSDESRGIAARWAFGSKPGVFI